LVHATPLVDDTSQNAEQLGHALHLVQDHQLLRMGHQKGFRIVKLPLSRGQLQVQIQGVGVKLLLSKRQSSFTRLARPEQTHRRQLLQQAKEFQLGLTGVHPCILSKQWNKYMVNLLK
jgi:hypothetical protein